MGGRQDRLLKKLYPGKDDFSNEEYSLANDILAIADGKTLKASALPQRFVPLGDVISIRGERYRCVAREDVGWVDCCLGCAFIGCDCPASLQCSKFDRKDGKNVWFQKV